MPVEVYESKNVEKVSDLINQIESGCLFRGHSSTNYKLIPGIFRLNPYPKYWKVFESKLIYDFQKEAVAYLKFVPKNFQDWLSISQHHGLPTRLLDWTANPLVALFFAVENLDMRNNAILWIYSGGPGEIFHTYAFQNDLDQLEDFTVYYPNQYSSRMTMQQGCFTVHKLPQDGDPYISATDEKYQSPNATIYLTKCLIKREHKENLKLELDKLGVNYHSIYPDLDGLSRKLTWNIQKREILQKRQQNS